MKSSWRRSPAAVLGLLLVLGAAGATAARPGRPPVKNFIAHLRGSGEVPPVTTPARGVARFQLKRDGTLEFKLNVSRIHNVVAAHIHLGPPDDNGPVEAFLFGPAAPGGGRKNGRLASGVLTDADVAAHGSITTVADLVAAMREGNTYVNVHTNDGVAPPGTGPGDFPSGEIRGQIRPQGR